MVAAPKWYDPAPSNDTHARVIRADGGVLALANDEPSTLNTPRGIRNMLNLNAVAIHIVSWVALLATATSSFGGVFVRFKVAEPAQGRFNIAVRGFRHEDPWQNSRKDSSLSFSGDHHDEHNSRL